MNCGPHEHAARGMLEGLLRCEICGAAAVVRAVRDERRYVCACPRHLPVDCLDVVVLGLVYDRRRQLGKPLDAALGDEPALLRTFVAEVTVGKDWSRPTITWHLSPGRS
ncbi:MAG TPA: hypothetical protein VFE14_08530 [Micromonosporaceae bacterium]|nr:hypothetical protein [Micromonosporaceae bacterium]